MAEWQSVVAQGSQGQFVAALEACSPKKRKWLGQELAAAAKTQTQQSEDLHVEQDVDTSVAPPAVEPSAQPVVPAKVLRLLALALET